MKFIKKSLFTLTLCFLSVYQIEHCYTAPSNSLSNALSERHPNRAKILTRYQFRVIPQYTRLKPEVIFNDFGEDEDICDLCKRQQSQYLDDYGHLRFGKRDEQLEDYDHMRFGRSGTD